MAEITTAIMASPATIAAALLTPDPEATTANLTASQATIVEIMIVATTGTLKLVPVIPPMVIPLLVVG